MRKINAIFLVLVSLFAFVAITSCTQRPVVRVCINNWCVKAEVADTPEAQRRGLMFRKDLPEDKGMLFIFGQDAQYAFWMKNMTFPLDIIWADASKRIVYIYPDALPCKDVCKGITPVLPARFVLELKASSCKRHNIKVGDYLVF